VKRVVRRAVAALLALAAATSALADIPVLRPAPQMGFGRGGNVFAIVQLPDGSVVVGGDFERVYDPATDTFTPRRNLAKFDASGALDPAFDPSPSNQVRALALGPDGSLFVGGGFDTIAGEPRTRLAKLAPSDGALDPDWRPFVDSYVYALAVDASGAVFVGGEFVTIGGLLRARLAKLSGTGEGLGDPDWRQDANATVWTLAVAGTSLYVGGSYTALGTSGRRFLAKLATTGTGAVDATWNPAPDGGVFALAVDGGGVVFAGGGFFNIGGQARNCCLARLVGATGASDTTWTYGIANSSVFTLARDANFLYVGGAFTTINGLARRSVARIAKSTGGLNDAGFNANVDDWVFALAHDAAGQTLYVGGQMRAVGPESMAGLARVGDFTGQLVERKFLEYPGNVAALAPMPDGGTLVAGGFTRVTFAGTPTPAANVIKLDAQYARVPWTGVTDGPVNALVVDAAGSVYVGGSFARAGTTARVNLAKFDQAGALDAAWNPAPDNVVFALALAPGGSNIYASGFFGSIGGQSRARLAKLATTGVGAADGAWNPAPDSPPAVLAVGADGSVYAGGVFQSIGGQSRPYLAKLSAAGAGSADAGWNPAPDFFVHAILADPGGDIVVGGSFSTIAGTSTGPLARLSPASGAASTSWGTGLSGGVAALARDAGGSYFVGMFDDALPQGPLVRIAPTGVLDPSWSPAPDGTVRVLAARGAELVVAGSFTNIAGEPRRGLAAFRDDVLLRDGFE
jgi:hypothetical protein